MDLLTLFGVFSVTLMVLFYALAKCERTIELPQNVETGAPRTGANDGRKGGQNITTLLYFTYEPFLEE